MLSNGIKITIRTIAIFFFLCLFSLNATATEFTLVDDNSTAIVETADSSGMFSWVVDGVSHLSQQWFWFRTSSMSQEQSIDELTWLAGGTTDTDFDGDADTLYMRYGSSDITIEVKYGLQGGSIGSGASDILEHIEITNNTSSSLAMSFFQYTDFDIGGDASDDTAYMTNSNTIQQADAEAVLSETVVSPSPSHYEIGEYSTILDSLEDSGITILADATSPYYGNATWAFEWDFTLTAGDTFIISKDKNLLPVPEPATLIFLGSGLLGFAGICRKRSFKA